MPQRYLSLLGSAGITLHDDDRITFISCPAPLDARRKLLSEASQLARSVVRDQTAGVLPKLTEIIEAASRGVSRRMPTDLPARQTLNFGDLEDVGGRLILKGEVDWNQVALDLEERGYTLRDDRTPLHGIDDLINAREVSPNIEVVGRNGHVLAGGSGLTRDAAVRGALAEAAERLIAQTPAEREIFLASAAELNRAGFRVPEFEVGCRDAYSETLNIDWLCARTLAGAPAAIPAERAYYNYKPRSGVRAFGLQHTAGLAAGVTFEEAIWAGLTECLERDAYWLVMRCKLNCPTLDAQLVEQDRPNLMNELSRAGLQVVLKDISLDWPIKIVHSLLMDKSNRIPAFSHGVGSHTSLSKAAIKAVLESLQMRNGLIRLCKVAEPQILLPTDTLKPPPLAWSDPAFHNLLSHLFEKPDSADACGLSSNLEEERSAPSIIEQIEHQSGPLVWATLGRLAQLHVVRVFVPKCLHPSHDPDFVPARLDDWLKKTGLRHPYYIPVLT